MDFEAELIRPGRVAPVLAAILFLLVSVVSFVVRRQLRKRNETFERLAKELEQEEEQLAWETTEEIPSDPNQYMPEWREM